MDIKRTIVNTIWKTEDIKTVERLGSLFDDKVFKRVVELKKVALGLQEPIYDSTDLFFINLGYLEPAIYSAQLFDYDYNRNVPLWYHEGAGLLYAFAYEVTKEMYFAERALRNFRTSFSFDRGEDFVLKVFNTTDYVTSDFVYEATIILTIARKVDIALDLIKASIPVLEKDTFYRTVLFVYTRKSYFGINRLSTEQRQELEDLLESVVEDISSNYNVDSDILKDVGNILLDRGNYREAAFLFNKAAQKFIEEENGKQDSKVLENINNTLLASLYKRAIETMILANDFEKAKEYYNELCKQFPNLLESTTFRDLKEKYFKE